MNKLILEYLFGSFFNVGIYSNIRSVPFLLFEYILIFVHNISDPTNLFGYLFPKYLVQRIYSDIRSALNKMFVSR
jgi:hypothetical protein